MAVSADSAVTIGTRSSRKVYNYANKVFNLTPGNPVGIMVYNNAEFCGIPWETIIKMYRKHGDNKTLPTVKDYTDNFLSFLKFCTTHYFEGGEDDNSIKTITRSTLAYLDNQFWTVVMRKYSIDDPDTLLEEIQKLPPKDKEILYLEVATHVVETTLLELQQVEYHQEFSQKDAEHISAKYERIIKSGVAEFLNGYGLGEKDELLRRVIEIVLQATVKDRFFETVSGLVFTGFGEEQIFPSLYALNIGCVVNGKIRYSKTHDFSIGQKKSAAIIPFAQTDIMQTFIEGIDPQLKIGFPKYVKSALDEIKNYVISSIDGSTDAEKVLIATLDEKIKLVVESLSAKLEHARKRLHINPMIGAISSLSKEDLTAMAESLINTTYLHRRASFAEESVGGPVDVAVITKGDGFIWIKRKHYFDPALNLNYTSQVIKSKPN